MLLRHFVAPGHSLSFSRFWCLHPFGQGAVPTWPHLHYERMHQSQGTDRFDLLPVTPDDEVDPTVSQASERKLDMSHTDGEKTWPTPTRSLLGPLTTQFVPPSGCGNCYVPEGDTDAIACTAFTSDCANNQHCLPGSKPPTNWWGFYSPGLSCPSGWLTQPNTMSYGMKSQNMVEISWMVELMTADETAVICCPR